ncbi:MAG: 2-C-methyl-D-erythritol 4-phosphate cytidylyltransferase [Balneola sp.]|nr:2-C-methyl-D-erythritol 4-phosphate cytidylyltransferase [Balneola sp.]|tara:strand:- start:1163 stop:1852 length:690 start_codon:yes stop_codon:yes gene_type:complete
MQKLSLIIPAAGSGVRLGSDIPKPFIKIGDKTILEYAISRFTALPNLVQVIVATSKGYISTVKGIAGNISSDIDFVVVEGGRERQFSIHNALQHVSGEAELVAVHDAVRPFIRPHLIAECCEVAAKIGGAIIGVPAKDTIKKVNEIGRVIETPDRSVLWQAQTPQVFRKSLIIEAYRSAIDTEYVGTDDASLVEKIGGQVHMVEGDRENLKITYPVDLKIAELILSEHE